MSATLLAEEAADAPVATALTHLDRLEAESIHILREVAAEAENPVLLYSVGKDSSVVLHLALKAFYPAKPPFRLLNIDTGWEFQDMLAFRERRMAELGLELIVHSNPDGLARGVTPFTHAPDVYTDIMLTQALRQVLDAHRFDMAIGGARRDEETSRAKERVFSLRNEHQRWDPKRQRAEPWRLYNTRLPRGHSLRVFPLSNWTELDVWLYIWRERVALPPLYFAAPRPVVERDGALIMVDDERLPLRAGEVPQPRSVRFRSLGCYPRTGAIESEAASLEAVLLETMTARRSERAARMVDRDGAGAMERKKQEGYF